MTMITGVILSSPSRFVAVAFCFLLLSAKTPPLYSPLQRRHYHSFDYNSVSNVQSESAASEKPSSLFLHRAAARFPDIL